MYDTSNNQQVGLFEQPGTVPAPLAHEERQNSHWYAITVYPRHERQVARQLEGRGIQSFVPTYRSLRRWKDRRKELDFVLFPGYVFVELELRGRLAVLTAPGVVRFVTFHGQPAAVGEQEINTLRSSFVSGVSLQPHPYLN